jgi:hypothetical protein
MMARVALVATACIAIPITGYSGQTTATVETIVAHHLASAEPPPRGRRQEHPN